MNSNMETLEFPGKPNRATPLLAGLLIGGLIGAGTMLLFAPQAGVKTRSDIQKGAIRLRDQTSQTMKGTVDQVKTRANQVKADVQIKVKDFQHQGRNLLGKQLDRISHAAEAGKKALEDSSQPIAA